MDYLTIILLVALSVNLILTIWLIKNSRKQNQTDNKNILESSLADLKTDIITRQMEGFGLTSRIA